MSFQPKWWVLVALGTGTFMSALDGSVVNTILPVVQNRFQCGLETIQWVVTVYLLIVSGLLLTFGRFGDLYGHRRVCASGFVLFVLGSALCGIATTATALIAARGFQAIGAAMIFATSPAILTSAFPAEQRGQALGMQATMTYLGLAVGPSLGGWLTDAYGWPMVFYINVPVGLVAWTACLRFIPADSKHGHRESFDVPGAAIFMAGLSALLLALNKGHDWRWNSPSILTLAVGALALLAVFVQVERKVRFPMLDLSLFRNTLFSGSVISALLNYTSTAMVTFLMPFYLIKGLGWTPSKAGLLLTVQPLLMATASPISGAVSDRISNPRLPAIAGMGILALAAGWLACLRTDSGWLHIAFGLAAVGLGTGMFISPNNSSLMGAAPLHRRGIAAGIMATARNVGMVLGVGLAGAIVTTMMVSRPSDRLIEAIDASFWVAALLAFVGIFASMIQGSKENGD